MATGQNFSDSLNTGAGGIWTSSEAADRGDGTVSWYQWMRSALLEAGIGRVTDASATADGSVIGILKRLRVLLAGGLPGALTAGGGVKVGLTDALPAGTAVLGHVIVDAGSAVIGIVQARPELRTWSAGAQVTAGTSSSTLLAANANRKAVIIQNVSANPARISTGTPTATTGFRLAAQGTIGDMIIFQDGAVPVGTIACIREGGTDATLLVSEMT